MSVLHITAIQTTSVLLSLCGKTQLYMNNLKMCKEQLNFMTDSMHRLLCTMVILYLIYLNLIT